MRFRNMSRFVGGLLAATILIGAPLGAAGPAEARSGRGVNATSNRIALGVAQFPWTNLADLDSFAASIGGHRPAIWSVWSDWGYAGNSAFPTDLMNELRQRGVVPLVFWQPDDPTNLDPALFSYQRIVNGDFDAYIRTWATDAKAWGDTVILRFAHEMDGKWFPWGVHQGSNTPALFKQAWQHIWNIFRGPDGVGATNVRFLWTPYRPSKVLYPGDAYVDYVGFTAINWASPRWLTMKRIFAAPMRVLARITHKRVIIAEMATSPQRGRKTKADWIAQGYPAVHAAYPQIAALVYFNVLVPGQPNWLLTEPAAALAAYQRIASDTRFQGSLAAP